MQEITPVAERGAFYKTLFDDEDITAVIGEGGGDDAMLLEYSHTPVIIDSEASGHFEKNISRLRTLTRNEVQLFESQKSNYWGSVSEQYDTDDLESNDTDQTKRADEAGRDRLVLLARQYVKNRLSREEDARLAIVTETLRRLIPRVTTDDFLELESIASRVQEIGQENAKVRARLESKRKKS